MTSWRQIPMRDINWVAMLPEMGPGVYALRRLCEPPHGAVRPYELGSWSQMTLGEVAALPKSRLRRHVGIGDKRIAILDRVIGRAQAGQHVPLRSDAAVF